MAQPVAGGHGEQPAIRPIPALHLHYAHRLLGELARRGPVGLEELLETFSSRRADGVEALFKGSRPHRSPLERTRQLIRYARELGFADVDADDRWMLTPAGRLYVEAGDPDDVFATTDEQREVLRDVLHMGLRRRGIARGVALTLALLDERAGDWPSLAELGEELGHRGGMTGWRKPRTFEAQAERFLALARDAGLLDAGGELSTQGRALLSQARPQLGGRAADPPPREVPWRVTGDGAPRTAFHIVLKWSSRLGVDTIERHLEVAEAQGAVWWGRVSRPKTTGISRRRLELYQAQLEQGIPTSVFLRGDTTWRTRLLEITTDRAEVDEALVPAYYDPATHHSVWVKLTDFEQVDDEEILSRYRRADGAPVTEGGLRNQTPVYLRGPVHSAPVRRRRSAKRASSGGSNGPEPRIDLATLRKAGADAGLLLPRHTYAHVLAVLASGRHLILTGPPGTAKTTLAIVVAKVAEQAGMCEGHLPTTATADWTTYETIGGLRPNVHGLLAFEEGHFVTAIRERRWLLIDELNRSQLDRAFGQLFTVLSGQPVVLPYRRGPNSPHIALVPAKAQSPHDGHDSVTIPLGWRIVATMNVFDKSLLFDMSFALMRRFGFVEVGCPDPEAFGELIDRQARGDARASRLARDLLPLGRLKGIGPAVFMDLAGFLRERIALEDASDEQLRFEAFYSFLLPQFEGIEERDGEVLYRTLGALVGPLREQLRRTLIAVLGLELSDDAAPGADDAEEDGDGDELDAA